MRIDGSSLPTNAGGAVHSLRPHAPRPGAAQAPARATRPATPRDAGEAAVIAPQRQAIPVEPPPGTDPQLWSILTADERAFFATTAANGPLTYMRVMSPSRAAAPPVARGGRLDVRG